MKSKSPARREQTLRKGMPPRAVRDDSRRIALWAAEAGLDKQALDIEIIDVTGKVDYADFLVVMTGQSDRHVSAVANAVDQHLAKNGVHAISVEGLPKAHWVLLDFVDVVVHVFLEEERSWYDLGGLWMDASRVPLPEGAPPSNGASGDKAGPSLPSPSRGPSVPARRRG